MHIPMGNRDYWLLKYLKAITGHWVGLEGVLRPRHHQVKAYQMLHCHLHLQLQLQ